MNARPAALYGPPAGRHDENVATSPRVMLPQALLLLAGLLAGAESALIARHTPGYSVVSSTVAIATMLLAGWALLAAGIVLLRKVDKRLVGALLGAASLAWFVAQWDSAWAGSALVFGAGLVLGSVCPVLVAHAVLRLQGTLSRLEVVAVGFSYIGTVVVAGLAKALFFDPRTAGCSECPPNPWLALDSPSIVTTVDAFAGVVSLMWSGLLIASLVLRPISYTPAQRRILLPVTAIAIGCLAVVFASYLLRLGRDVPAQAAWGDWLWLIEAFLLAALATAATAWPAIALRLTRYRLVSFLFGATHFSPIGGLSTALADLLHDPSARLIYPLQDGRLVDAAGVVSQMPDDQTAATRLTRGEQTVAYLLHRPGRLDEATTGEVVQAARLALDNERLHAEREAQLRELRESRRRIVATADRERRSLERDLHDGAQQKVLALALTLRLARLRSSTGDASSVHLSEAEDEVAAALAELRRVARGLFPTELADEGLEAALESLTEATSNPMTVDALVPDRLPASVESAAFFSVVHLTEQVPAGPTFVRVRHDGATLRLEVNTPYGVGDLTAVEDRVGALGGAVEVVHDGGPGRLIKVELPCES
jgi:signal transduction histidine kinase